MTPDDLEPMNMTLAEVAELLMKTPGALYKQILRKKVGDLPIYNVGTTGTGKRYAARAREIYAWLDTHRGGAS